VDVSQELKPGRDFVISLGICLVAGGMIFSTPVSSFPTLHTILNTGIALVAIVLSLLFWDLGWRTGETAVRLKGIVFAVVGVLEVAHVLAALDPSSASEPLNNLLRQYRSGTWAPPSYLLPIGLAGTLWAARRKQQSELAFTLLLVAAASLLFALFQILPKYSSPGWLGIVRPTLALVPVLWMFAGLLFWRRRNDRIDQALAFYAVIALLANALMPYSDDATSKLAMTAHFGMFGGGLYLLMSLMQMGSLDTARRMRAERELAALAAALEARVSERTAEVLAANATLREQIETRQVAERETRIQVDRLNLLHQISRAIGERQDTASIFQVVVGDLEEQMPVDFAGLCHYDQATQMLTMGCVGKQSAALAATLGMAKDEVVAVGNECMHSVLHGELVHEPDLRKLHFPFPERLLAGGLHTLVAAPLIVENRDGVFGLLLVARKEPNSFSNGDCEFLHQLSGHVALAVNQAQLHQTLQRAYDELRETQQAVMQQERLRTLGQMASGIAHDINNAISPVVLYVDALLTHETGFSERARKQLEIIQRATGDVAHTVARMGEFYRQREAQLDLTEVNVNELLKQVLDLTRARWSDMAQQRGAVIETKIECLGENLVVMGIESELREALVNLVFNATDAMPEGGTLTLRAGSRRQAGNGQAVNGQSGTGQSGKWAARRVYIEVSDTGAGMDEATRRRCLEPFFTTKGERGSGLGLAMVYGITQRHSVDIEIVSAPGVGSTFRLIFPPGSAAVRSPVAAQIPRLPPHTRILLIDDDPLLLKSLREALVNEGHEVQTANGGKAGIDSFARAQNEGAPFRVVITDLGMPHVDGRAVAAAIRARAPETAIIMLTGWGQRLVATGDTPEEVDAVLSKPPKMAELRQCLVECLGG
jgi:signal transduction histidine kinase/ActR/RegA family two-component response regulator